MSMRTTTAAIAAVPSQRTNWASASYLTLGRWSQNPRRLEMCDLLERRDDHHVPRSKSKRQQFTPLTRNETALRIPGARLGLPAD